MSDLRKIIDRTWSTGGQVFRTLYVDSGTKNPRDLFGLVDDAQLAQHIVDVHNWWLDMKKLSDDDRRWLREHGEDDGT